MATPTNIHHFAVIYGDSTEIPEIMSEINYEGLSCVGVAYTADRGDLPEGSFEDELGLIIREQILRDDLDVKHLHVLRVGNPKQELDVARFTKSIRDSEYGGTVQVPNPRPGVGELKIYFEDILQLQPRTSSQTVVPVSDPSNLTEEMGEGLTPPANPDPDFTDPLYDELEKAINPSVAEEYKITQARLEREKEIEFDALAEAAGGEEPPTFPELYLHALNEIEKLEKANRRLAKALAKAVNKFA